MGEKGHEYKSICAPVQRFFRGCPPWTLGLAVFLFTIGSILLGTGVRAYMTYTSEREYDKSIAMIVLGCISFPPGFYAVWTLYGAWRRWPGYSYDQVPSYDDY